jgi:hypothetical protein
MSGDSRRQVSVDSTSNNSESTPADKSAVEAKEVLAAPYDKNDDNNKQYNPLNLLKPISVIFFVSCYSPLFLAFGGLGMSILFQNFKGLIFIGWMLVATLVREAVYMWSGAILHSKDKSSTTKPEICTMVEWKFSNYGNPIGYSIYIMAFTIMYVCLPMYTNGDYNIWIFGSLIFYLLLDIFLRFQQKCITNWMDVLTELLPGAAVGALTASGYYWSGLQKYLFFNEISSTKSVCSMPSKQTFKCAVYKNGEMIGSTTKTQ